MAGHNRWSKVKHRKAAVEKRRGKVWTKIAKAIIVAAKHGGGDPASNLTLRYAMDEARYANMPRDTVERAIKKGAGGGDTANYETIRYEGYAPGGIAVLIDALTDNRARTVGDVRLAFSTNGGNMGNSGAVGYLFQGRGRIAIKAAGVNEETLMEAAINAGAVDVQAPETGEGDADAAWTVLTEVVGFPNVKESLEKAGFAVLEAELAMIPENMITVRGEQAKQVMDLVEALEDLDDVQKVYTNADVPEEEMG